MICNKTPGIDGLTSEFSEAFWYEFKTTLLLSYKKKLSTELSISKNKQLLNLLKKKTDK